MGRRKQNVVKREPNGRASRKRADIMTEFMRGIAADERDVMAVGLTARHKVLGVPPNQTRDQMAGSVVGRWCMQGAITRPQYDAAMAFLESHDRNLMAIDAPRQPGAVNLNATRGRPVELEDAAKSHRARAEYRSALAAIQAKQNEIRLQGNLYGALYAVVIRDVDLEHLKGDCRLALNALIRHFKIPGGKARKPQTEPA